MAEQLNKIQIKAEILTAISVLRASMNEAAADKALLVLAEQEDKDSVKSILIKELKKADEQKVIVICFMLLKLFEQKVAEDELWKILKDSKVCDITKSVILNVLKDMGNRIEYDKIEEYFENPDGVIDEDTKKLLQNAVFNPEAQIDFLDFLNSLQEEDKLVLIQSLGEDYDSDDLANILNPVVLYEPESNIAHAAIEILGETKSQLALHSLQELLNYDINDVTKALVKKNISKLKLSGIREENALDFYKSILNSSIYDCYASYPDGHGNQAIIFSREKEDEHIQMLAVVINDTCGIIDSFGFNEISKSEFERIVNKFYGFDDRIFLDAHVIKKILEEAEKLARKVSKIIPYEYICWKTILADITSEAVPIEMKLESRLNVKKIDKKDVDKILMLDFIQKWFFDNNDNDEFASFVSKINDSILNDDYSFNLENIVNSEYEKVFDKNQKKLTDKRILMSSYLGMLSGKNIEAELLYSLYKDENAKLELYKNMLRKSFYEYYVSLKFKLKEEAKTTNIFALRNRKNTIKLSEKQIDKMITIIEDLWVNA